MEAQANSGQSDVGTTTEASLSVVRRIHTKERAHKCNVCGRDFIQSSNLDKHMMTHTGERPHGCKICSKTFIRSADLVLHMRTHTGEKPFGCEYCKKSFSAKSSLTVHRRIHTNERPHKCNVCGRAFIQRSGLHRHMRIHTGERPEECNSKKSLEIHIKMQSDSTFRSSPVDTAVNLSLKMKCSSNNSCSSNSDTSNAAVSGSSNEMIPSYGYGNREQQESVSKHCATIPDLQVEGVFAGGKFEAGLEALEEEDLRREFFGNVEPEPLIIAPSSSVKVSPASTPKPRDVVASTVTREAISLPPKKRYKMILESMHETKRNEKLAAQ